MCIRDRRCAPCILRLSRSPLGGYGIGPNWGPFHFIMPTGRFHSVAAFIDVGFLTAEGARTLQVPRRSVKPNAQGCVDWIRSRFEDTGSRLLRVYWYDGAFDPPLVGRLPDRIGRLAAGKRLALLRTVDGCPIGPLRAGHRWVQRFLYADRNILIA